MADIEQAVFHQLRNSTGVTAQVPSSRMYALRPPQDPTYPALSVTLIDRTPVSAMGSDVGEIDASVQVSVWDASHSNAKAVAAQVRDALTRWQSSTVVTLYDSFLTSEADIDEPETRAFHIPMRFQIWYRE